MAVVANKTGRDHARFNFTTRVQWAIERSFAAGPIRAKYSSLHESWHFRLIGQFSFFLDFDTDTILLDTIARELNDD